MVNVHNEVEEVLATLRETRQDIENSMFACTVKHFSWQPKYIALSLFQEPPNVKATEPMYQLFLH